MTRFIFYSILAMVFLYGCETGVDSNLSNLRNIVHSKNLENEALVIEGVNYLANGKYKDATGRFNRAFEKKS